jgi:hypothetical protein
MIITKIVSEFFMVVEIINDLKENDYFYFPPNMLVVE